MTENEFLNGMIRLRDLGCPAKAMAPARLAEILAAVARCRQTEGQADESLADVLRMPAGRIGRAWKLPRDLAAAVTDASRHPVDLQDENVIGWLDLRHGRMSLQHKT